MSFFNQPPAPISNQLLMNYYREYCNMVMGKNNFNNNMMNGTMVGNNMMNNNMMNGTMVGNNMMNNNMMNGTMVGNNMMMNNNMMNGTMVGNNMMMNNNMMNNNMMNNNLKMSNNMMMNNNMMNNNMMCNNNLRMSHNNNMMMNNNNMMNNCNNMMMNNNNVMGGNIMLNNNNMMNNCNNMMMNNNLRLSHNNMMMNNLRLSNNNMINSNNMINNNNLIHSANNMMNNNNMMCNNMMNNNNMMCNNMMNNNLGMSNNMMMNCNNMMNKNMMCNTPNNNLNMQMNMGINNSNINLMNNMNNLESSFNQMNLGNNNINNEIRLKFTFVNTQSFLVKCKLSEKLSEVIARFKKTQCPQNLKESLTIPLFSGQKVDTEKTLSEIGLKNNQIILFISTKKIEDDDEEKKEGYKLQEDEIEQIKKWKDEYEGMKLMKQLQKLVNNVVEDEEKKISNNEINNLFLLDSKETVKDFYEFVKLKESGQAIPIKEHPHKLVLCVSILNWKCSLCNINYDRKDAKYFCSLCNFNMCDKCHTKKNYQKKKLFNDDVEPSNTDVTNPILNSHHHQHQLVYLRSSRSVIGYNSWICDICRLTFDNEVWSFYCTQCDFDLCTKCAGYN